jgi:peptide chain release factor subunit 1
MTPNELQSLFERAERTQPSTLSVYLNVDQSERSNRNRGFEEELKVRMANIRRAIHDARELEAFQTAAHQVEDFVSAYEPNARGLVLFFDVVDGFFWHQELGVRIHSQVRWDRELFLQPLANAVDQFERYGIVLVDRSRLRLFAAFLGEIEEISPEGPVPGANLRHVVMEVDRLVQTRQVQHLVLAGDSEVTSELRGRLPKRLALRVIGTVNVAMDAAARDILSATQMIAEEYEHTSEAQTVKEIVRAAGQDGKTVAGLGRTLKAVNAERVWELIYSEGFASPGFECTRCAALFSRERKSCLYCGSSVRPVGDVVERAVEHAVRKGAKIEIVTGEAAASLYNMGGIAAFLKTRAAATPA